MTQITIKIPSVAHIVVTGPTQCGKSIVMDRIQKALSAEFGANVISSNLDIERRSTDFNNLAAWEKELVKRTTWVLSES
jgi:predicted AAA+ superfamily ATPase